VLHSFQAALPSGRIARLPTSCVVGFTSSQRREAIGERFAVAVTETYSERYNLAPQQRALIVRERDDERLAPAAFHEQDAAVTASAVSDSAGVGEAVP
jgi:hypothetical protein